ncbi:flagellar hook-length control protein FliK [Schauerella aestuarii]|uniref:flagellar hook-length control protein FliK n=1 Tax=Schauerella aestuarii TaxID=2511204 RepID=UPI001369FCA0|nr:flagellar hook-length control protein FliK [Achromobacter aestuarii]MYZ44877.1 flagellar hook-length control protein FliK [Achromobacter aestuarii]
MSATLSIAQMISPAAPVSPAPPPSNAPQSGQSTFSDTLQRQREPAAQTGKPAVDGEKAPANAESKPAKPVGEKHQADGKDQGDERAVADAAASATDVPVAVAPALTLQQQALEIARESAAFRRGAQAASPTTASDAVNTEKAPEGEFAARLQMQPLRDTAIAATTGQTNIAQTGDAALRGSAFSATLASAGALRDGLTGAGNGKPATAAAVNAAPERGAGRLARDEPALKLVGDARKAGVRADAATAATTDSVTANPADARQAAIAALTETVDRVGTRQSSPETPATVMQASFASVPAQILQAAPSVGAPALHVATPFGAAEWGDAFGQQVAHLTMNRRTGMQTAELRLDPPDLGPIRVTLTIQDGTAHAAFSSAHGAVRQAIEASMPQLQQALAQSGIALAQSQVSDQGQPSTFDNAFAQSQNNNGSNTGNGAQGAGGTNAGGDDGVTVALPTRAPRSLVDTFA